MTHLSLQEFYNQYVLRTIKNRFGTIILRTFQVRTCMTMISSRASCPSMFYCTLIICTVCEFSDGMSVVYEIHL